MTNIFEYSNILGTNIYSDIRSGQFCLYEYIRTFVWVKFVCTNIFRHSFMSVLESENRPNIRIYSNIRTIFNTNIYSDIRSCQICYTNIFGCSKFSQMSHSGYNSQIHVLQLHVLQRLTNVHYFHQFHLFHQGHPFQLYSGFTNSLVSSFLPYRTGNGNGNSFPEFR